MATTADVPLLIRSENSASERRITPSWSITQLKARLEPITGVPASCQSLTLKIASQASQPIQAANEDAAQLAAWPLQAYAEIYVGLLFHTGHFEQDCGRAVKSLAISSVLQMILRNTHAHAQPRPHTSLSRVSPTVSDRKHPPEREERGENRCTALPLQPYRSLSRFISVADHRLRCISQGRTDLSSSDLHINVQNVVTVHPVTKNPNHILPPTRTPSHPHYAHRAHTSTHVSKANL